MRETWEHLGSLWRAMVATAISHEAGSGMRAGFKHIQAIDRVSATILGDGTAVTWAMVKWAVTAVRWIGCNLGTRWLQKC